MHGTVATLPELIALQGLTTAHHGVGHARGYLTGRHASKTRGRGMDVADIRHYQAGDEIRHMEWRITARTGRPHIKVYEEERERPVVILVDFNQSMFFGTRVAFKSVIAAHLASLIAWTACRQGDKIGGLAFSDTKLQAFDPRLRHSGILPLLASLSSFTHARPQTTTQDTTQHTLCSALQRLQHVTKPGSLVVLISDFYQLDAACNPHLNRLSLKNQLLAFQVCDPIEQTAPTPGLYPITNGQQSGWLDVRSKSARAAYQNQCDANICRIEEQFNALHTPCTVVTPLTDLPPLVHRVFPRKRHG